MALNLHELGWNPHFEHALSEYNAHEVIPVRISRVDRANGRALGDAGEWVAEWVDEVAVGDWVTLQPFPGEQRGIVQVVLPRLSQLSRGRPGGRSEQIIAANVDTVFITAGLDHNFNPRRIERAVTQVWNSGANPVVLLNKVDLCEDLDAALAEVEATGVDIFPVCAQSGEGLDALAGYLKPGKTVIFLGSSGVGKSTLINRLVGEEAAVTTDVREGDSKGRHTTTRREMFLLPGGGIVIDNPGTRELGLWTDRSAVRGAFSDIEEIAENCRFNDCTHDHEPGCAVRVAIEADELDSGRLANFQKLLREAEFVERKLTRPDANAKARWKEISKQLRKRSTD